MITLNYGNVLRLLCKFDHRGAAYTGAKVRAAIGKKGIFFDEILSKELSVSGIKDDIDWTQYQVTVDIPITTSISAGSGYEAYVKLMSIPGPDIFWYGPLDDITIVSPVGEAEFGNLTVSYQKA